MSTIVSRERVAARHWTAVAAAVAEYLEALTDRAREAESPEIPKGAIAAAIRFFNFALDGVAVNQKRTRQHATPVLAGLSSLTIALQVFASLSEAEPTETQQTEQRLRGYLAILEKLDSGDTHSIEEKKLHELRSFFEKLEEQGTIENEAVYAAGENPRVSEDLEVLE